MWEAMFVFRQDGEESILVSDLDWYITMVTMIGIIPVEEAHIMANQAILIIGIGRVTNIKVAQLYREIKHLHIESGAIFTTEVPRECWPM